MMRRVIASVIGILALFGCQRAETHVVWSRAAALETGEPGLLPNLTLGPSEEYARMAETLNYRSDWPATRWGYRFDDIQYYYEDVYDSQTFYDRWGGGFLHDANSFRSGVLVR